MKRFVSNLYGQRPLPLQAHADAFSELPMQPADHIVLCRDVYGSATAIYGNAIWDFSSYHLLPGRNAIINFGKTPAFLENPILMQEVKKILFFMIYVGNENGISVTTLIKRFRFIREMAIFCQSYRENCFVGTLTIEMLITNKSYLKKFCALHEGKVGFRRVMHGILSNIRCLPRSMFALPIVASRDLHIDRIAHAQVCVIPSRIYMAMINFLSGEIAHLHANMGDLDRFISCFGDKTYGISHKHQRKVGRLKNESFQPTFSQAVKEHGLENLLVGRYNATDKREFCHALSKMQYLIKVTVHLYTGMRDQEVSSLLYGCIKVREEAPALIDDEGSVRDPSRSINIISTTTKLVDHLKTESWIAAEEVIKAVEIAEKICTGLSIAINEPVVESETFLFLGVTVLAKNSRGKITRPHFCNHNKLFTKSEEFKINKEDFEELCLSDPGRNFACEPNFAIGAYWKVASHQFRRSLAYYASSSGFVSEPSLKKQFKHTCLLMARYYSNNFKNFKSIFGYFDQSRNETLLSGSHVAYEFQIGISNDSAEKILAYLLDESTPLHGAGGVALENRRKTYSEDIKIAEIRSVTEKAVKNGELAYRKTLLGGCAKLGPCDELMLGNVTSCVTCESAIIEEEKIIKVKTLLENEISQYSFTSAESQICRDELQSLNKMHDKIRRVPE